jgi:PAS domain S-box-containing protein
MLQQVRVHGTVIEAQQFQHADGSVVLMDMTITMIPLSSGNAFLATLRDASERRQSETIREQVQAQLEQRVQSRTADLQREMEQHRQTAEALSSAQQRLRHLLSASPVVIFSSKASGDFGATFVSDNIREVFGYEPHEFTDDSSFWANHIHPDDAPDVFANLDYLFVHDYHEHEYRFRHKDDSYIWTENHLRLVRDENGQPVEIVGSLQDISERKHLERELKRQQQMLGAFFNNATAGMIIVDKYLRYRRINEHGALINGVPVADHLGRTVAEVLPHLASQVEPVFLNVLRSGEPVLNVEVSGFTPADPQTLRYWQASYFPLLGEDEQPEGVGTIFVEVSEQKQAVEALRRREELHRLLSESSRDMICLHEPDGTFLYVSNAVKDLLDYEPEELIGTSPYRLFHPFDRDDVVRPAHNQALQGPWEGRIEYRMRQRFGTYIWFETSCRSILDDEGRVVRLQTSSRDISERRRTQEVITHAYDELEQRVAERTQELSQLNELLYQEIEERTRIEEALAEERASLARRVEEQTVDLKLTNARLAHASRLKDEFLANMSHELRTPLNAILGLSEALQEEVYGPLTTRQRNSLRSIEESGRHLLALINDILDLSKIEAGKTELEITMVEVEALTQASLRMVKNQAHKKRLEVSETSDNQVSYVWGDERRLKQVLVNLLTNAVKFTPERGQVGLEVQGDAEHQVVRFTVWDSGIGIAQEDMSRLFKPFEQLDSGLDRHHEGTGLGLVLVARLVEMHRGSITVESEVGQGSRFIISLPWQEPGVTSSETDALEASGASLEDVAQASNQQTVIACPRMPLNPLRRALVIEDSPSAADQVTRYLNELGIETVTYGQGNSAVSQVLLVRPDIIILDILLPDVSGWDILTELKQHAETRDIPVIITSVVDEPEQAIKLHATAYLVKPVTREHIQSVLQHLFPQMARVIEQVRGEEAEQDGVNERGDEPLILLAEDNEENITMTQEYLAINGCRVEVVRNGLDAVAVARELKPALILMDIQMPGMDGMEATRRIRADETLAHIPIIALTALAMSGDRERCLEAGANEYLSKPVRLRKLLEIIRAYTS